MVKAELAHNPYLLVTDIKFNGQTPKINSLVEKYLTGKLQDWMAKLPDIFYSEMNGWDFDLDFSGTSIDFEALQEAFDAEGVSRDSVCLFHKNEIECVERKDEEITELLAWLEHNPNRKFAFADFRQVNASLLNTDYSLITVQGHPYDMALKKVTVENVSDVGELKQAALDNTPILFYVNEQNRQEFRRNLIGILKRADVKMQQLFFCINPNLNRSQVERIIRDLGVDSPQIVDSPSANVIKRYLEVYPMTAYVQQVIRVLRGVQEEIDSMLRSENEQSVSINGIIHQKIDYLDEIVQKLKTANERITQRDNFEPPVGLTSANNDFMQKILSWRKKKIMMTSDEEAVRVSTEFDNEIQSFFSEFISQVRMVFFETMKRISTKFLTVYNSAGFEDKFKSDHEGYIDLSGYALPALASSFFGLKSERHVEQNDSPFGLIKNMLGNTLPESKELVRVVTYLYQEWRENAVSLASPIIAEVIRGVSETLKDYYENIAQDYLDHLKTLIDQQTQIKDDVALQLSDDERELQADNDWFSVFQEKQREIERG